MVRIRLRRIGSKGKALYKIIVADQRSPQKGKYIEEVGTYDPHTNPASINLVEDKISEWILIDYTDIIVHIFQKNIRLYYNLEDLWGDADRINYKAS